MKNSHFLMLAMMLFLTSSTISFAQESSCGVVDPPEDEIRENASVGSFETCFGCNWHSPKTIRLVFHIIRDENGKKNFYPAVQFLLEGIVDVANQKIGQQPTSLPTRA